MEAGHLSSAQPFSSNTTIFYDQNTLKGTRFLCHVVQVAWEVVFKLGKYLVRIDCSVT